ASSGETWAGFRSSRSRRAWRRNGGGPRSGSDRPPPVPYPEPLRPAGPVAAAELAPARAISARGRRSHRDNTTFDHPLAFLSCIGLDSCTTWPRSRGKMGQLGRAALESPTSHTHGLRDYLSLLRRRKRVF